MRLLVCLSVLCLSLPALADERGGESSGGGDTCESRIQEIRDDIGAWIRRGGASGLILKDITLAQYVSGMEKHFPLAKISCVGPGDIGYPVEIHGTPKVCRFDSSDSEERITCDFSKFNQVGVNGQYMLVHHEFAGLAGIENPDDDVSSYTISNQIAGFMESRMERRLGVVPHDSKIYRFPFFGHEAVLDCTDAQTHVEIDFHPNGKIREFFESPGYAPACLSSTFIASGKVGSVGFYAQFPTRVHFYTDGSVEELYSMETSRDNMKITLDPSLGSFEQPTSMNVAFHPNGAVYWVRNGANRYPHNRPLLYQSPNGKKTYARQLVFTPDGKLDHVEECTLNSNGDCR